MLAPDSPSRARPSADLGLQDPRQSRRRVLSLALALPAAAAASACSNIVPGQNQPPELFRLSPKSTFREDLPPVDWQLVLETPTADAGLNTTRVALQRSPFRLEYFARASWTDRAPLMVQTLMIESFENSEKIISIGRRGALGLRADFVLETELREFQVEYFHDGPPQARVGITTKMIEMPQRGIIASRSFTRSVPAQADRLDDVIVAFDEALGKVLRNLVEWTLAAGTIAFDRR